MSLMLTGSPIGVSALGGKVGAGSAELSNRAGRRRQNDSAAVQSKGSHPNRISVYSRCSINWFGMGRLQSGACSRCTNRCRNVRYGALRYLCRSRGLYEIVDPNLCNASGKSRTAGWFGTTTDPTAPVLRFLIRHA